MFTPSNKKTIFSVVLLLIISGVVALLFNQSKNNDIEETTHLEQIGVTNVEFPDKIFSVEIPEGGFYNHGIQLSVTNEEIHVEPTEQYDVNKGAEFVVFNVLRKPLNSDNESEQGLFDTLSYGSVVREYAGKENNEMIIDGQKATVFAVREDATRWYAVFAHRGMAYEVSLTYKSSPGEASMAAYENNDRLFSDLLKDIELK